MFFCLVSFTQHILRSLFVLLVSIVHFFLSCSQLYGYTIIYLFTDCWIFWLFWALTNKAAMNTHTYLCMDIASFLFCKYLGFEWLDHMVNLCLNIWETAKLFSEQIVLFYILTNSDGRLINAHPHQHLVWYFFFS